MRYSKLNKCLCSGFLSMALIFLSPASFATTTDLSLPLTTADARHLISRTGIGVTAGELTHLAGTTRGEAIDFIMGGFSSDPTLPMPAWTQLPAPLYWTRSDLGKDERRLFDRRRDSELGELRQWWVDNMLATTSPQTERMVLFWHNHFATSYHGVNRQSKAMAMQNTTFRNQALGNFRTLLKSMLRDPALLNYLDNLSNRRASPNENLARELLELFTLSEGNFTETTVKEAARALTGFGVSQNKNLSFEFQLRNHDTTAKHLFGETGKYDADDLVDLILQQPAVAQHIATKFWLAFVSQQLPTPKQLAPLVTEFTDSNYELAALYRTMLEQESFWAADARAAIVKSPVQLLIGYARATEFPTLHNQQLPSLLKNSGMDLFAPPNVAGWSAGNAWITPGRLLNRYAAINTLLQGKPAMHGKQDMQSTMNNMMSDGKAMKADQSMADHTNLELHIAAEDYQGAAEFRAELYNHNDELLWASEDLQVQGGHNTSMYGRIQNSSDLPWQAVSFPITEPVANASTLRIYFLNDKASPDGDRNLFVRGANIGGIWADSTQGEQFSKCTPRVKYDAGKLYCNGHINIPITNATNEKQKTNAELSAASVHVNWIRQKKKQLDLTLTLQDFNAFGKYYPTYSFHLQSKNNKPPQIQLNNYGCWPHCIEVWPRCAWQENFDWKENSTSARKSVGFPFAGAQDNKTLQCHFNALNDHERKLIASLFRNAHTLLAKARTSNRTYSPRRTEALNEWQHLLEAQVDETHQRFGQGPEITVDKQFTRKQPPARRAHQFKPGSTTPENLERSLIMDGLNLTQLLLPGIEPEQLPELNIGSDTAVVQLRKITQHPAFQLH